MQTFLYRLHVSLATLGASTEARFSSLILFQRYVCQYFNNEHDKSNTDLSDDHCLHLGKIAIACIFLGCKAEEEYQTLRNIINVSSKLGLLSIKHSQSKCPTSGHFEISESDQILFLDESYWYLKESIIKKEQETLRMLVFDVVVPQPHRCMLVILRYLHLDLSVRSKIVQHAWKTLNNAALNEHILRHSCMNIASAALWLALNDINKETNRFRFKVKLINEIGYIEVDENVQTNDTWWSCLGIDNNELYKVAGELAEVMKLLESIDR